MEENSNDKLEQNQKNISEQMEFDAEKLAEELEEMRLTINDCEQKLIREKAEIENQRKRMEREIENASKYAIKDFITKLLPAKDSMEKGLDIVYMENGFEPESLLDGMTATLKICNDVFRNAGVEEIKPQGEVFNPEFHEAMSMKKVDGGKPNIVLTVFQKGYLLNGRLIRPASVQISTV